MADRTIRGTVVPLQFGVTVTTGYITEEQDFDTSSDMLEIEDETNNVVIDVAGMSEKATKSIRCIPLTATTSPPDVGDIFAYGTGGTEQYMVVDKVTRKRVKKDVERWDIEGHEHPLIDLSV